MQLTFTVLSATLHTSGNCLIHGNDITSQDYFVQSSFIVCLHTVQSLEKTIIFTLEISCISPPFFFGVCIDYYYYYFCFIQMKSVFKIFVPSNQYADDRSSQIYQNIANKNFLLVILQCMIIIMKWCYFFVQELLKKYVVLLNIYIYIYIS